MTKEEERAIRSKGGKKSGETRRRQRTMREATKILMDAVAPKDYASKLKEFGITDEDMTNQMALIMTMLQSGLEGDVRAAEFVRDTLGENPAVKQKETESEKRIQLDRDMFEYKKEHDTAVTASDDAPKINISVEDKRESSDA